MEPPTSKHTTSNNILLGFWSRYPGYLLLIAQVQVFIRLVGRICPLSRDCRSQFSLTAIKVRLFINKLIKVCITSGQRNVCLSSYFSVRTTAGMACGDPSLLHRPSSSVTRNPGRRRDKGRRRYRRFPARIMRSSAEYTVQVEAGTHCSKDRLSQEIAVLKTLFIGTNFRLVIYSISCQQQHDSAAEHSAHRG